MKDYFEESRKVAAEIAHLEVLHRAIPAKIATLGESFAAQLVADGNGRLIYHALDFCPRLLIPENGDHDYNISTGAIEIEYDVAISIYDDVATVWDYPDKKRSGIRPDLLCGAKVVSKSKVLSLFYSRRPSEVLK